MILKLAYRNLWRNRRRTLITISSVGGGMMFSLLFTGIQDGGYSKMIDAAARLGTGHVTLENRSYRADPDIKHTIADYRPYLEQLHKLAEINHYSLRLSGQAMLASAYNSVGVFYDALVPEQSQHSPMPEKILRGGYLSNQDEYGVIIGDNLARKLKADIGSKVVLTLNNRQNQTHQELLHVVGIFHVGADAMDGFYFQMLLPLAQKLLGYNEHEVLQVAVLINSQRHAEDVVTKINRSTVHMGSTVARSWSVVMEDLANYIAMDNAFNYIFQVLSFLIIAAGILNTVLMSVMERRFEFGVMLAVGISPFKLFRLVAAECAQIGLFGIALGSLLGLSLNAVLARFPIDLKPLMRDDIHISGYAMEPLLRSGLYLDHYLIICGLVYLLVVVVGLYPAWKAARTVPVQALMSRA